MLLIALKSKSSNLIKSRISHISLDEWEYRIGKPISIEAIPLSINCTYDESVNTPTVALFCKFISLSFETFSNKLPSKKINFGNFIFDIQNRSLSKDGKGIPITTGEFNLLKVFTERPKQSLSRDQIMQLARGKELDVFDRSIDVQISRIRKLIEEDPNNPKYLQTKWGFGYIFNPDGE